ncbi:chorismate synthase [Abyssisolibacter fermentans]|uniref:chorismate synthase n=1 Tax=Abyssisolibacter fermentans TaxID=1766203 RepID=UPI00082C0C7C|nr:chorismate synthase [Abyssisolibacter fermentans]
MSGMWGKNIRLSIFGESHGECIGIVIDGLKAGIQLDLDYIRHEMKRRAPGNSLLSTPRKEKDEFEIMSGYFNNRTTGSPLCCMIKNNNTKSRDYDKTKHLMRPGHADYTGYIKHGGFNDYRGGGHFSGRLTAPLVFAGAIAKQILEKDYNIFIGSHIKSISNIEDQVFGENTLDLDYICTLRNADLAVINTKIKEKMKKEIIKAKEQNDSVGGVIETAIINVIPGLGEPFFDSVESRLSQMLFSVPAVKGVEFGAGFDITRLKGSEANDEYKIENGIVKTLSNNNGGILGGITNGMPIIFRTAIKPTPSIAKQQTTINIKEKANSTIVIEGRHDPCIVPRALPVIDSVAALVMLDMIWERKVTNE